MNSDNHGLIQGDIVSLGNSSLEASIELGPRPRLARITNKATGRKFSFEPAPTCALRVASAQHRIDISEWRFILGSGEAASHDQDLGYVQGFWKADHDCANWGSVGFINDFPIGQVGHSTVTYPGYAWYRASFDLPEDARGETIDFRIGGCDNQDWLDYWVYVNGAFVGECSPGTGWHAVPAYTLNPSDPAYASLNFGGSNALAVQVRGLDRRFPEMHLSDAERYSIGTFLLEQSISVGPADRVITDFELRDHELKGGQLNLHLVNESEQVEVNVTYTVPKDEAVLLKRAVVTNKGSSDLTLLEIELENLSGDLEASFGGIGLPSFVDGELFGGISHPTGIARGEAGSLSLATLPGRVIAPGESYESKTAVIGAGGKGQAGEAFTSYLERHGHRKRDLLTMYHSYGIVDIASIHEPTDLTEEMLLSNLDDLEKLQGMGAKFDYYFIDAGFSNPTGDLRDFDPKFFPNGPGKVRDRISELGMKLGLWTSPAAGPMSFHPGAFKPDLADCGSLPKPEDDGGGHRGTLCLAAPYWRKMYSDALLYHVRENGVVGFKLDANTLACNNPHHGHMLAMYSLEALADTTIKILDEVRQECPDVFIMYYWNLRSPWWLLHGDTIYERGVLMEGSTPADAPTPLLRQSITLSFDQASHHAWDLVPLVSGDSLGVWISQWRWANYIRREGWRDAWIMDTARGSMMCQIWGDLSFFDDDDNVFFANTAKWFAEKADLLRNPKRILGDPWSAEPYGYSYFDSGRGIVFVYNPTWDRREVRIELDSTVGGGSYAAENVYPLTGPLSGAGALCAGDEMVLDLGPFEVRVVEVNPVGCEPTIRRTGAWPAEPNFVSCKQLACNLSEASRESLGWDNPSQVHDLQRAINGRSQYVDFLEGFSQEHARWSEPRDNAVIGRILTGSIELPATEHDGTLYVICQAHRDGVYWHHQCLYDIIRLKATVDGCEVTLKSTPHRWHEEAGGWSWIHFEAPIAACSTARVADIEITVCLPETVAVTVDARLAQ